MLKIPDTFPGSLVEQYLNSGLGVGCGKETTPFREPTHPAPPEGTTGNWLPLAGCKPARPVGLSRLAWKEAA
jgi:hypothetical protein